jgi:hypothetical protein
MVLPTWEEIPVANRRSLKKYHEYIRSLELEDSGADKGDEKGKKK